MGNKLPTRKAKIMKSIPRYDRPLRLSGRVNFRFEVASSFYFLLAFRSDLIDVSCKLFTLLMNSNVPIGHRLSERPLAIFIVIAPLPRLRSLILLVGSSHLFFPLLIISFSCFSFNPRCFSLIVDTYLPYDGAERFHLQCQPSSATRCYFMRDDCRSVLKSFSLAS